MDPIAKALRAFTERITALAETVRTYESDTFSAEGSRITKLEAVLTAISIANSAMDWAEEHLDGLRISENLDTVRDAA